MPCPLPTRGSLWPCIKQLIHVGSVVVLLGGGGGGGGGGGSAAAVAAAAGNYKQWRTIRQEAPSRTERNESQR
jgi:hypothetical protein